MLFTFSCLLFSFLFSSLSYFWNVYIYIYTELCSLNYTLFGYSVTRAPSSLLYANHYFPSFTTTSFTHFCYSMRATTLPITYCTIRWGVVPRVQRFHQYYFPCFGRVPWWMWRWWGWHYYCNPRRPQCSCCPSWCYFGSCHRSR